MPLPLVIYHGPNCADGFCAAWIARRALGAADLVPAQYGQPPPDVTDRDVFILDFSYNRPVLLEMLSQANSIVVLDHHKTAEAELAGLHGTDRKLFIRFDMDKSGGRLTWEHFHRYEDESPPWLVEYTEDRDLWRFKLPESRVVNAFIGAYPFEFDRWDKWASNTEPTIEMYAAGRGIIQYQDRLIEAICANAREIELDGRKILAANTSVLFSEVAGKLAEGRPFGVAWFVRADGLIQYSLRSRDDGVDVSEVAKKYGGGGHRDAAGFESRSVQSAAFLSLT